MCGLAGFTFKQQASRDNIAIVNGMLRRISYRGPDQQDAVEFENAILGHNRLTIMEPHGGAQPRISEDGGLGLAYNGEIYNHNQFNKEIVADGGQLRDHCDTEKLFWLLRLWGVEKTLATIDGMFAFAWYRRSNETLYLARDRFGQKPLFYAEVNGQLIFASEIKALRRHPDLTSVMPDQAAMRLYLMMEYVPGPATGLEGIYELPAGHMLSYCRGNIRVKPYWKAETVSRVRVVVDNVTNPVEKLDQKLNAAIQQQLVADVPVGVFLSGGLDSSLVAAIARRHKRDVETFTVKFPYASFDESAYAQQVADSIGTDHKTVALTRQNCTDGIARLLAEADQPFADSSMLPSYLLCEATKRYVTVALGGDGADELFLGYPNFKLLQATKFMAALPSGLGSVLRGLHRLLPNAHDYMNASFLIRQLSYGIGRPAATQSIFWMSAVPPHEQQRLWRDTQPEFEDLSLILGRQIANTSDRSVVERCQLHFIRYYLANDILRKMDRASMYNSLEVRSPYLSNAVSDFALKLPIGYMLKRTEGKRILRQLAETYLPKSILMRRKHGFAMPVSQLLKADLRDIAESVLLDSSNPVYQYLEKTVVAEWLQRHTKGKADHGKALWAVLMLAAFLRKSG